MGRTAIGVAQRWAEVDLGAIRHNLRQVQARLPRARVLAVVKADGYGHGARPVARAALEAGAFGLAVSTVPEAEQVRDLCPPERILLMGGLAPEEMAAAAATGCAVTCYRRDQVEALESAASVQRIPVHLKIDTGMGRLGCSPAEAPDLARAIAGSGHLSLAGTYTHFASADSDPHLSRRQFELFQQLVAGLGVDPGLLHAGNSAAVWRYPESALDAVRLGISLYGCDGPGLRPALALRARIVHLKTVAADATIGYGGTWRATQPALIATVAIGYADGVHRTRSNRGELLVGGRRAPLVGRVSMDSLTLDLSTVPEARVGDPATLIGQDGDDRITAEEVAGWSGTIPNEVLTSIGPRVERRYLPE